MDDWPHWSELAGIRPLVAGALSGCGDAGPPPPPQPVESNLPYVIGPGNSMSIFVYGRPEVSSGGVIVRPDGRLSLPLIPDVIAAGKTPDELAKDLEVRLKEYIKEPNVSVIMNGFVGPASRQVRVIGEAVDPVAIPYRDQMTVLDVMIADPRPDALRGRQPGRHHPPFQRAAPGLPRPAQRSDQGRRHRRQRGDGPGRHAYHPPELLLGDVPCINCRYLSASNSRRRGATAGSPFCSPGLVCAVGFVAVFRIPNVYEASARLYVDADAILTPLLRGIAVDTSLQAQVDLLQRTLLSRPNLEKLISKTDLELQTTSDADRTALADAAGHRDQVHPANAQPIHHQLPQPVAQAGL